MIVTEMHGKLKGMVPVNLSICCHFESQVIVSLRPTLDKAVGMIMVTSQFDILYHAIAGLGFHGLLLLMRHCNA